MLTERFTRRKVFAAGAGLLSLYSSRVIAQSRSSQAEVGQVGGLTPIPFEYTTPVGNLLVRTQGVGPDYPINLWRVNTNPTTADKSIVATQIDPLAPVSWSPRGDRFLANAKDSRGNYQWTVFDSRGKVIQRIDKSAYGTNIWSNQATWHPSGEKVIIPGYTNGLYAIDVNTGTSIKFLSTSGFTYDHSPAFSPDGNKLVFVNHRFGTRYSIFLVDFDWAKIPYQGANPAENISNPEFKLVDEGESDFNEEFKFQFTPDSKKVVYVHRGTIHQVNTETGSNTPDSIDNAVKNSLGYYDLSPSGTRLAVVCSNGLNIIELTSGTSRVVYPRQDIVSVKWSPSGNLVGLVRNQRLEYINSITNQVGSFEAAPGLPATDFDWRYPQFIIKSQTKLPFIPR